MTKNVNHFRSLHTGEHPLILPNAWDVGSAKITAAAGAAAIATTSAGVAWACGLPDGGALSPQHHIRLAEQLIATVDVPISLDVEDGYSTDVGAVAHLLSELGRAGVAGVNLEDSTHGEQQAPKDFSARLHAVRQTLADDAVDLFINARIDSYLLGTGEDEKRVLDRALGYTDAGADGIFLPGLADPALIERLCAATPLPVNIMVPAGNLGIDQLKQLGVARISTGSWGAQLVANLIQTTAAAVLAGDLNIPTPTPADYATLNQLMT